LNPYSRKIENTELRPIFLVRIILLPLAVCIVTALFSHNGFAYQKGDILIRAGMAVIDPREESDSINMGGMDLGEVGVESQSVPIANVSYFVSDHLAFEVLLSKPPVFEIVGTTGLVKGVPIGDIEAYPLLVTVQYFFLTSHSVWQPYLGIGFNYVVAGDTDVNPDLAPYFGAESIGIEVEESWGLTLSAGLDFIVTDKLSISAQAYYADVEGKGSGTVIVGGQEFELDIFSQTGHAPVMYSLTLAYTF